MTGIVYIYIEEYVYNYIEYEYYIYIERERMCVCICIGGSPLTHCPRRLAYPMPPGPKTARERTICPPRLNRQNPEIPGPPWGVLDSLPSHGRLLRAPHPRDTPGDERITFVRFPLRAHTHRARPLVESITTTWLFGGPREVQLHWRLFCPLEPASLMSICPPPRPVRVRG